MDAADYDEIYFLLKDLREMVRQNLSFAPMISHAKPQSGEKS